MRSAATRTPTCQAGPACLQDAWPKITLETTFQMGLNADAMKNVNTINYEPLSKDQIEAARKRRLRERWDHGVQLARSISASSTSHETVDFLAWILVSLQCSISYSTLFINRSRGITLETMPCPSRSTCREVPVHWGMLRTSLLQALLQAILMPMPMLMRVWVF